MNHFKCQVRQLTEYRECHDGRGYLFYVVANGDTSQQSGIYLMDKETNPQMKEEILLEPLAHSFLDNENPFDNLWHLSQEKRIYYLLSMCRGWLSRNQQALNEFFGVEAIREYDDKLRFIMLNELDRQNNAWSLRVKLPADIKRGFIPYFYHLVAAGSIIQLCKQSSNTDQVATYIVKYLHKEGDVFPMEQLRFDFLGNEREWFKNYVEIQLRNLARRTGNDSIYIEESTEWLSNYHRKELLNWELECYEKNKIIFDILPNPQWERFFEYTKAFFYHMLRHIDFSAPEMVDKVKRCLNGVYRQSDISDELLNSMPNLPFPSGNPPQSKAVYEYIKTRKKYDKEFALICNHRTLVDVCKLLRSSFDTSVDENTFGKWLNRNRKSLRD